MNKQKLKAINEGIKQELASLVSELECRVNRIRLLTDKILEEEK